MISRNLRTSNLRLEIVKIVVQSHISTTLAEKKSRVRDSDRQCIGSCDL